MSAYKITRILFSFTAVLIAAMIASLLLQSSDSGKNKKDYTFTIVIKQVPVESIRKQNSSISTCGNIIYGRSGLAGKRLVCIKIAPEGAVKNKILMTYEIHGYEDLFFKDGQKLVNIGNAVARYFENNRSLLQNSELYIVPSVNPDGLSRGVSADGVGRCQASLGIDMNRDFSYNFKTYKDSRNHTLNRPFSAPESMALKNLVDVIKPNIVIDCHGWAGEFIGDGWLANQFSYSLGITNRYGFTNREHGFFSAWAGSLGAKAMLLEYPKSAYIDNSLYAEKTVEGIENLAGALY